jgi:uncharacterized damage-inducible protein DinB
MNARQLFGHWVVVRRDLLRALDQLADEQLDFVPREGLWSLGTVARHIANAEEGWFRYAITRELDVWPPRYSADACPTVASIKQLLAEVHARTEAYLETLAAEQLDEALQMPWGAELSRREIIWHVLEHEVHHRGEIFLMLGLMGMEAPDI